MVREKQTIKVYICSSIGFDYFFLLEKTIHSSEFEVEPVFLISETKYRTSSKSKGLNKLYLRFQMYIVYPLLVVYKSIVSTKDSIFIVTSNTFFTPLLVKILTFYKSTKVVHLLYDLFPDAAEVSGVINTNGMVSNLIGFITKKNQSVCDATVYLGSFLKEHTENRWGMSKLSKTIDISTDLSLYDSVFNPKPVEGKVIIHYGGQLGHLHDAISIIECVKSVLNSALNEKYEFIFYVSGAQSELLKNSLPETQNVKIKTAIDSKTWRSDIKNFHIGLVSLSPGGASVCLPSKTYAMMAGGLSIIGICPCWSDLANLITKDNNGWVVNNSEFELREELMNENYLNNINTKRNIELIKNDFINILNEISDNNNILVQRRNNAFHNVRRIHGIDSLKKKWQTILNELK